MKRFLALFLIVVVSAFAFVVSPVAGAEEIYYVVPEGQEVYLQYARMVRVNGEFTLDQARVLLPTGYTVKIVGNDADQVKVAYCGLTDCYIDKSDLDKMAISPSEVKLPDITVKVDDLFVYRYVEEGGVGKIEPYDTVAPTSALTYLGTYVYNTVAYYAVKVDGAEGVYYTLVSHSNEAEVNAVLHPAENIVEAKSPQGSSVSSSKDKEFTWVRFVLILGVIVPLITIVLMIVRPSARRRRQHREIYDDEDDYDGIDEV